MDSQITLRLPHPHGPGISQRGTGVNSAAVVSPFACAFRATAVTARPILCPGMGRSFPMIYVPDVRASVSFYERALRATLDHVHEEGSYAEITLGSLTVGLVDAAVAAQHLPATFRPHELSAPPAAFELYVEVEDVDEAAERAIRVGAMLMGEAADKPWGQRVAYLRDPDGVVIELASGT